MKLIDSYVCTDIEKSTAAKLGVKESLDRGVSAESKVGLHGNNFTNLTAFDKLLQLHLRIASAYRGTLG